MKPGRALIWIMAARVLLADAVMDEAEAWS